MALVDNAWYINFGDGATTGYYALTKWATGAVTAAGVLRRQLAAPAVGSERVFVCVVAGTTHASTEPTWVLTRGSKTTDNTVTWQESTGIAALNGDLTNTPIWSDANIKGQSITLGQVIQRVSAASYQICTTAGTAGSGAEPAFSNTAGTTTADNTVTWTSLGAVANFNTWKAPHARLANALASTWGQAGNTHYIASIHAETQATAMTLTFPGTTALPDRLLCVSAAGSVPPVAADLTTGASITTTATSNITLAGYVYGHGVTFNCGTGAVTASIRFSGGGVLQHWNSSALNLVSTGASSSIDLGSSNAGRMRWTATTVSFGTVNQVIFGADNGGDLEWRNSGGVTGATFPANLFGNPGSTGAGRITLDGVDLSMLGSGKTLVADQVSEVTLLNCKLGASVTIATTSTNRRAQGTDLIGCSSTTNVERNERYRYEGTLTTETTIIRTAGATDGTTPYSWKIVGTANAKRTFPFETFEGALWNATTGSSKTLTFHCVTDNVTLQDADIWCEIEYLGSSATPAASLISSAPATQLTAGANLTTDTEAWTTTGLTTPVKQKFSVTFTPQMAGAIRWKVKVAKASTTVYVDPYPDLV